MNVSPRVWGNCTNRLQLSGASATLEQYLETCRKESKVSLAPSHDLVRDITSHKGRDSIGDMAPHSSDEAAPALNNFDASRDEDDADDVPPDGGYGWFCVAGCFTINCFTWGIVSVSLP
jgi:hypothetical protein